VAELAAVEPRRFGRDSWVKILSGSGAIAVAAVLLMALVPPATGLITFVLLTLWCHGPLSPFLPAAYEPILLAYGQLVPPALLAVIGALASAAVEYVNYHLYRRLFQCQSLDRVLSSAPTRRLMALFVRHPFFTVWLCVLTPLPDWVARVLASYSGYSVRRYLTALLLARIPRFWFLAMVGLHLDLGPGAIIAIAAGFVVVAFLSLVRHRAKRDAPMASPASVVYPRLLRGSEMASTMRPTSRSVAAPSTRARSAWATMPTSTPSSSTTGTRRTSAWTMT
jgi:membrane protein YqaA with SNARE-associated domain